MPMPMRLIAGKYELVQQIGGGGMGQIWQAFDQNLRRPVALKLMSTAHVISPSARARFECEARAIAKLQSPYVVQVFDAGIDDGPPYIVMELLTGEDLANRLERVERLPISALVPLVSQAAAALMAAHAQRIVHRDLKPANVFLVRSSTGDETVKILDFGTVSMLTGTEDAKQITPETMEDAIWGTPPYMSPEQIRSEDVDHRSDLWSLGVLAYRALTGTLPFQGNGLGQLIVSICTDPFPPPSSILSGLSPAVDAFFDKALAKDPSKRFHTAAEFAAAFAALANASDRGPAKILVVDDEPDIAKLVKLYFRKQIQQSVYAFIFAHDGESALGELRKHPDVDMVLTDINMPGMDGLTLLSHVGDVSPLVRTVVVSAYSDMRNIRTAMNRGAFDFLVKPIDFNDLGVTIEKTLRLVADLRKNARSSEENSVLRLFVSPSLVEKVKSGSAVGSIDSWPGTVAFIGVAGHDALPAAKGPDEHVRILNANFEVIVPAITRYAGVVHKFFGPAVLAVFRGDDHLARAFDACLDIRAQLTRLAHKTGEPSPYTLGVSMGIATGEIISGAMGSKAFERLDFALLGEVPAAAVRLQAAAGPNQVHVSAAAFDAGRRAFAGMPVPAAALPNGLSAFELLRRVTPPNGMSTAEDQTVDMSRTADPAPAT